MMTQNVNKDTLPEFGLIDYILAIKRRWWLVLAVMLMFAVVGVIIVSGKSEVYETNAKLLVVNPLPQTIGEGTLDGRAASLVLGGTISETAILSTALAHDLLQGVIDDLDLRDEKGELMGVPVLRGMLTAKVERRGKLSTAVPMLELIVKGKDPKQIQAIAENWLEAFQRRQLRVYSSDTKSIEKIERAYDENEVALEKLEVELLEIKKEQSLDLMKRLQKVDLTMLEYVVTSKENVVINLLEGRIYLASYKDSGNAQSKNVTVRRAVTCDLDHMQASRGAIDTDGVLLLKPVLPEEISIDELAIEIDCLANLKDELSLREKELRERIEARNGEVHQLESVINGKEDIIDTLIMATNATRIIELPGLVETPNPNNNSRVWLLAVVLGLFFGLVAAYSYDRLLAQFDRRK